MRCRDVLERMSPYMDGELDSVMSERISSHISRCSQCREELQALGNVDTLLKELQRPSISLELATKLVREGQVVPADRATTPGRPIAWLLEAFERLYDLLHPLKSPRTGTLEEFSDVPSSFMGFAYFKIIDFTE
jgi:predicted anti-sigma-YlaC factor YlaD